MHVAQIPFLSILAPAREELQLKLIEELHSSTVFGLQYLNIQHDLLLS